MLGVSITSLTPDVKDALGVDIDSGALVTNVLPDSAAERAGIQVSDVITELDGERINSSRELRNRVGLMRRDEEINLVLLRDGEEISLDAVIGGENGMAGGNESRSANSRTFRGAQLRNLTAQDDLGADSGVVVDELSPQSRAAAAGLRAGDVITSVNRQPVADLSEFNEVIENGGRFTAMTIIRDSREMLLLVP